MEERKLKVNFYKSGSGSISSKTNIPISFYKRINVTPEERDIIVTVNDDAGEIIIKKDSKN